MHNTLLDFKIFTIESKVKEIYKKFITFFGGFTKENNHLVAPSSWLLLTAKAAFIVVVNLTSFMHNYLYSNYFLFFSLFTLILCIGNLVEKCYKKS